MKPLNTDTLCVLFLRRYRKLLVGSIKDLISSFLIIAKVQALVGRCNQNIHGCLRNFKYEFKMFVTVVTNVNNNDNNSVNKGPNISISSLVDYFCLFLTLDQPHWKASLGITPFWVVLFYQKGRI